MSMSTQVFHADNMFLTDSCAQRVRVELNAQGRMTSIATDAPKAEATLLGHWVLPGMPNLHSHAFQRAMAGMAERSARADDSFWNWREIMYAFAERIGPDQLQAIAAQLYVEMLKAGYTHVCEFHYLHNQPDGSVYADPAAMSRALIAAAREAGIGLTLLPTLYMSGGFDGRELSSRQRRFGLDVDAYLSLLGTLRSEEDDQLQVGVALHSLRAVPPAAMLAVLESEQHRDCPIHIHIAEQIGEVQDCLAVRNTTPVQWLLDNAPVDDRWCLVHATHMNADEVAGVAASGAVVGLCPSTEGNLGDGLFPLKAYLEAGGRIGIGSDSHISVSPREELRWLEYGQRLQSGKRNVAANPGASVGESLWRQTTQGGARASGQPAPWSTQAGEQQPGSSADFLVLDDNSAWLAARGEHTVLDSFIFAGNEPLVRDVMVAGKWRVRDFHHHDEERIATRFKQVVEQLARN